MAPQLSHSIHGFLKDQTALISNRVSSQGSTEEEKRLSKSTSLLESQHHHLLTCLEKTTVSSKGKIAIQHNQLLTIPGYLFITMIVHLHQR